MLLAWNLLLILFEGIGVSLFFAQINSATILVSGIAIIVSILIRDTMIRHLYSIRMNATRRITEIADISETLISLVTAISILGSVLITQNSIVAYMISRLWFITTLYICLVFPAAYFMESIFARR